MTKEKKADEKEPGAEEPGEGEETQSPELVQQASDTADRLEAANAKQEELLDRQEKLAEDAKQLAARENAQKVLGGKADAGVGQKEETPEEYAEKVMKNERTPPTDT